MRKLNLERLEDRITPATLDLMGYGSAVNVVITFSDATGYSGTLSGGTTGTFSSITTIKGNSGSLFIDDTTEIYAQTYTVTAVQFRRTGLLNLTFIGFHAFTLDAGSGINTINVSQTLTSNTMPVTINGGSGTDALIAPNVVNDWTINSSLAYNTVLGATGSVISFGGIEKITGGSVADSFVLIGSPSLLTVSGGSGSDTLDLSSYSAAITVSLTVNNGGTISLTSALSTFSGIENITTGSGNDVFVLADGVGVSGRLDSGSGDNWLDYSAYSTPVVVTLVDTGVGSATNVGGNAAHFGNVIGGFGNDVLTTNSSGCVLVGGAGNDRLIGGSGKDVLVGGSGADTIDGQEGEDAVMSEAYSSATLLADMQGIKTEWQGGNAFNTRVTNIITTYGGNVSDDAVADRITGGSSADWFWCHLVDTTITDFSLGTDRQDDI